LGKGGKILNNTDINNLTDIELKQYILKTKSAIEKVLNEYLSINNEKLVENEKIETLKNQAHNIKEIYEQIEWAKDKISINDNVLTNLSSKPKRGEIWTCQLGKNIGSEENKIRPVVIVQNDTGNDRGPTTIVVPISHRHKKIATHIMLRETDYILEAGEENKIIGTILCEQIKVVSKARLGRHVATLCESFVKDILNSKLKISIDL
jgi:Growth inhibitor